MQGIGPAGESCPFEFNFDPATFKVGDVVSYRITGSMGDFPFVGSLAEVHDDHVVIGIEEAGGVKLVRGTRESRPIVQEADALA